MGKGLLISDIQLLTNFEDLDFCDVSIWNLDEILVYLKEIEVDYLVIYAELKYANVHRSDLSGIELLKHIRLTPELGNINKKPILLLHWLNIVNYIECDKENIILFSPGIILKRLPVNDLSNLKFEPLPCDFKFHEYLFNSEKDEQISAHNFRNQIAIAEFNKQSTEAEIRVLDKPIWFKKLFYKNIDTSQAFRNINTQLPNKLRVLLIDDMANEWEIALSKVIPNANIEVCTSKEQAIQRIQTIKNKIILNEEEFNNHVKELDNVSAEIEKLKVDKRQISGSIESNSASVISAKNKIDFYNKSLNEGSTALKLFLNDFITSPLADMLISSDTEVETKIAEIDLKAFRDAERLKDLLSKIVNAKKELIEEKKRLLTFESKKLRYDSELKNINLELNKQYEKQKELIPKTSFEKHAQKEFDLILLDLHLTKESEGNPIEKIDGFEILNLMQKLNITIPAAIFSATTKNLDILYNRFSSFLYKHNYIKGITPIDRFVALITSLDKASSLNYLVELINKIMQYPTFYSREYISVDDPEYKSLEMSKVHKTNINSELNQISKKLILLKTNYSIETLKEIVKILSKIQKEYRFKLIGNLNSKDESLLYYPNIERNQILYRCWELNDHRNNLEHPDRLNTKEKKERHEAWLKRLDLNEVKKHLTTLYEGLIFDK